MACYLGRYRRGGCLEPCSVFLSRLIGEIIYREIQALAVGKLRKVWSKGLLHKIVVYSNFLPTSNVQLQLQLPTPNFQHTLHTNLFFLTEDDYHFMAPQLRRCSDLIRTGWAARARDPAHIFSTILSMPPGLPQRDWTCRPPTEPQPLEYPPRCALNILQSSGVAVLVSSCTFC
jgi:hypothetical protein